MIFLLLILITIGLFFAFHFDVTGICELCIVCLVGLIIFSMIADFEFGIIEIIIVACILGILSYAVNNYDDSGNYSNDTLNIPDDSDIDSDENGSNSDYDIYDGYKNPCIGTTTDHDGNERKLYRFKYHNGDNSPVYYRDDNGNIHYVN